MNVFIELSKDKLTGGFQLSIGTEDADGLGHGYRIAGPKFSGGLMRKFEVRT